MKEKRVVKKRRILCRIIHNPIQLNIENYDPFLAFPLFLLILTNLPNPIAHLIASSLKTTKNNNSDQQIQQFHWL
jgi:hypothetical protein